jgi:hypothetical protein
VRRSDTWRAKRVRQRRQVRFADEMGFFDRLTGKKADTTGAASSDPTPVASNAVSGVPARLASAREKLEAKDLPGAIAIYEELLASSGDRPDVLVAISGDLGTHGHIAEIIELIAPRYDADRHGPATGLNLLQAYLAARNADAAQHVLDILFGLNRPELEERLYGFSNAIAELINERHMPLDPGAATHIPESAPKVGLVTLSKPVWFYGLEPLTEKILPAKQGKLRRIAFAQLALPTAYKDFTGAVKAPEDELGRISRGLPLWFAETFYFSPHYHSAAALGIITLPGESSRAMLFGSEWTTENLRQLVDTSGEPIDYVITGALRQESGDYELLLRVWEVKKFRERKTFSARWTPATVDTELLRVHEQVRTFMEWSLDNSALPYAAPTAPRAWIDTLGASLGTFFVEKTLAPVGQISVDAAALDQAAKHAPASAVASLAYLTLRKRAAQQGVAVAPVAPLAPGEVVAAAAQLLA